MLISKISSQRRVILPALLVVLIGGLIVGALAGRTNHARDLHGPILTSLSPTQAALVWESRSQAEGTIVYRATDDPQAAPLPVKSTVARVESPGDPRHGEPPSAGYFHRVTLDGLRAATTYSYHVTAGLVRSKEFTFRTPELAPQEIVFAVYGDTQSHPEVHRQIVKQLRRHPVQFILHTGDLAGSGTDLKEWEDFFDSLRGLGERVPVYAAKGNHDFGDYFEAMTQPLGRTNDYSFTWGNAHFTCLDNAAPATAGIGGAVADLEAATADWKILFYHVPSLGFGDYAARWQYPESLRAWDRLGVDFVQTGHSHVYERVRPLRAGPESRHATTYITSGGGGGRLGTARPDPLVAVTASVHHFCLFTIKGRALTMQAIRTNGQVIDQFSIEKGPAGMSEEFLKTAILMSDLPAAPATAQATTAATDARPVKDP